MLVRAWMILGHRTGAHAGRGRGRSVALHALPALALSAMLAGCSSSAPTTAPSNASTPAPSNASTTAPTEKPTITLKGYSVSGDPANILQSVVDIWNARPDSPYLVKLDVAVESQDSFIANHRVLLSSSTPPDFSFLWTTARWYPPLVDAGLIVDLKPYATKYGWQDRFTPAVWQSIMDNSGGGYNIAYGMDSFPFVYYNKDLFKQLNLTVPDNRIPTLAQFQGYVKAAQAAGLMTVAIGNKDTWPGAHLAEMLAERVVDKPTLDKLKNTCYKDTGVKWTDPAGLKILQAVADWGASGAMAKGFNTVTDAEAETLFESGKAIMWQSGSWGPSTLVQQAPKLNFGVMHFPQLDPSIPVSQMLIPAPGFVISSKSQHKDEVAALIDVLLSKEGQKMILEKYGIVPATKLLAGDTTVKVVHPTITDLLSDAATLPGADFHPQGTCPDSFVTPWIQELQVVFDGTETPAAAAPKIQKLAEQSASGQ